LSTSGPGVYYSQAQEGGMATEIYSCKDGQALTEGKLDISHDVETKEQAEADAKRRCQRDPTLKKVAYYKVGASGDFRVFYSYTNPNCKPAGAKPAGGGGPVRTPAGKKAAPKPGLVARLKKTLGL
jgi:hypothetical protein